MDWRSRQTITAKRPPDQATGLIELTISKLGIKSGLSWRGLMCSVIEFWHINSPDHGFVLPGSDHGPDGGPSLA